MVKEISVHELKKRIDEKNIVLIDVRERHELEVCKIGCSIDIRMDKIQDNIGQLDKKIEYAIICHSGVRSFNVAFFLINKGFLAYNVTGGIDSWAIEVDTMMKRY